MLSPANVLVSLEILMKRLGYAIATVKVGVCRGHIPLTVASYTFCFCTTMDIDGQHDNSGRVPAPFEVLWLPDGNIILATDTHLFKVHKSILSMQSSVFKDMLELPIVDGERSSQNCAGMTPELYEGLPLVRLVERRGRISLACCGLFTNASACPHFDHYRAIWSDVLNAPREVLPP